MNNQAFLKRAFTNYKEANRNIRTQLGKADKILINLRKEIPISHWQTLTVNLPKLISKYICSNISIPLLHDKNGLERLEILWLTMLPKTHSKNF
jgi:hypothetical protein